MSERLFVRLAEDALVGPESGTPASLLCALTVDARLRDQVAGVMSYRERFAPGDEVIERVVPDGAVRLVFHVHPPLNQASGERHGTPTLALVGPTTRPALVRLHGDMQGLSLQLRPGAVGVLFKLSAADLADQVLALSDLWPREGAALLDRLATLPDNAARARALQAALLATLARRRNDRAPDARSLVAAALRTIEHSAGQRPTRDMARTLGVGERRLQQLFREQVGLSAKAVSRLARLQWVLRALRQMAPPPSWAELAAEGGYSDQAHLANEFRALSGLSPTQFLTRSVSVSSKTAA